MLLKRHFYISFDSTILRVLSFQRKKANIKEQTRLQRPQRERRIDGRRGGCAR